MDIANSVYGLWHSEEFRSLIDFDNLSQTEQDRIFNEVEVTGLGLIILYLDKAIADVTLTEYQIYFNDLQKSVIAFFIDFLKEIGIPEKFVKVWKQLIDIRLEEYREDYQTALDQSKHWEEFQGDLNLRKMWAQIETLAIDSLRHIRRGKTKKGDPLWKLMRTWLFANYKQISQKQLS